RLRVIGGVVRPRTYTGAAMNNFAYAHQVVQQPGRVMPNAFLVPMNKIASWWAKDWMERHTYFLRSEEHTSELQSHRDLHSFPTRRSSDLVQQPGRVMPNAFLVPMNKIASWWAKDWMERHTYFL